MKKTIRSRTLRKSKPRRSKRSRSLQRSKKHHKGGNVLAVIETAAVPFGLLALQKKLHRRTKKKRAHA